MSMPKRVLCYIKKEGCNKSAFDFTPDDTIKEAKEAVIKKESYCNVSLKPTAFSKAERDKIVLLAADGKTLTEADVIKEVISEGDTLSYSFTEELTLPKYKEKKES